MSDHHEPPNHPNPHQGPAGPGQQPETGGQETGGQQWSSPGSPASPWGVQPAQPSGPYGHAAEGYGDHRYAAEGYGGLEADPTARNWAVGAHLSGFVAAWIALGFLGPLTVLLVAGNTSPFVRRHAIEALNFNLSILIYVVVSALLMLVLIGFVLLPIVGLVYLVATVRGALAASRGEDYRYPLTIRFIR